MEPTTGMLSSMACVAERSYERVTAALSSRSVFGTSDGSTSTTPEPSGRRPPLATSIVTSGVERTVSLATYGGLGLVSCSTIDRACVLLLFAMGVLRA